LLGAFPPAVGSTWSKDEVGSATGVGAV